MLAQGTTNNLEQVPIMDGSPRDFIRPGLEVAERIVVAELMLPRRHQLARNDAALAFDKRSLPARAIQYEGTTIRT